MLCLTSKMWFEILAQIGIEVRVELNLSFALVQTMGINFALHTQSLQHYFQLTIIVAELATIQQNLTTSTEQELKFPLL